MVTFYKINLSHLLFLDGTFEGMAEKAINELTVSWAAVKQNMLNKILEARCFPELKSLFFYQFHAVLDYPFIIELPGVVFYFVQGLVQAQ